MEIRGLIIRALVAAKRVPEVGGARGLINRNRSREFVEALASQFRDAYADREEVVVLSRHYDGNRDRFGLNELLYDVSICATATVTSAAQHRGLTYVAKSLWAIESEFARDSRQAVFDFNKLVLGSANEKLFIGPQVSDEDAFLDCVAHVADACSGTVSVALVPHPNDWVPDDQEVRLWTRRNQAWIVV